MKQTSQLQPRKQETECRFCLEADSVKNLLAPCICKGSFKYVHNSCLMKWYEASPDKGLKCSACCTDLARKYSHELESYPEILTVIQTCIYNPLSTIVYVHFVFFFLQCFFTGIQKNSQTVYTHVQILYHGVFFRNFIWYISMVKNKQTYVKTWLSSYRVLLPIVHLCILTNIESTYIFGGVTSDACMFLYFFEHYAILDRINEERNFIFTNQLTE